MPASVVLMVDDFFNCVVLLVVLVMMERFTCLS